MKFQPQTLLIFFFSYLAIFFANGPLASAYVVTSLNASTSIVPISARDPQAIPYGACRDRPCEGDITHCEAGLAAYGVTSHGNVDRVVALPDAMMGPISSDKPSDNPYCGSTYQYLPYNDWRDNDSHCCWQLYALRELRLKPFQ